MKPLAWRLLVLTDAGVESPRPAPVTDADAWLGSLGAAVEIPGAAGAPAARLELRDPSAFTPQSIAARLGAGATPAAIDAALHHPALQRVESAWRGLRLLLEHAAGAVEVEVMSAPRKSLAARFRESVFKPELESASPLSLVIADFEFSHKPEDLAIMNDLAGMAKVLQAPIVAAASASFFDFRFMIQAAALPDLLSKLGDPPHASFRNFQATEPARWIALAINRYLQRTTYTAANGHAETASESNPDSYLWGRSVWLVGAAIARSVRSHGHAYSIAGPQGGRFEGLATREFPTKANVTAPLATEVAMSESQMLELHRAAFTPVVGPLRSSTAIIPMAVTVFRLTPGRLTVEATIAYQIAAARLAQFCGQLLDAMPAGSPGEVAAFFREELTGHLGSLAGEKPEDAVSVTVREQLIDGEQVPMAEVRIKPAITLESKAIDFGFMLPLRAG